MTLKERKEKLKEIVLEAKHFDSEMYIYRMIDYGYINHLIKKLDDTKITCYKPVYGTKSLSSEEYFIYLLTAFMGYFRRNFPYVCHSEKAIWMLIFENHENGQFLLTKKDYHNNENLSYFLYEMKKTIVSNPLEVLKYSYKDSNIIKEYFNRFNIDFDKFSIDNQKDVDKLFNAIVELAKYNSDHPEIAFLFRNPYIINEPLGDREEYLKVNLIALKVLIETLINKVPIISYKDMKLKSS